jgi:hypothetical protein
MDLKRGVDLAVETIVAVSARCVFGFRRSLLSD